MARQNLRSNQLLSNLFFSYDFQSKWAPSTLLFLIISTFAIAVLYYSWGTAIAFSSAIAGYYQVSDAVAYWIGSNAILDMDHYGATYNEWLQRRSIYPHLLSGINWLGQRNIFYVLVIQSLVVSISIFLFVRQTAKFIGLFGALICAYLLCIYCKVELYSVTLTANAGLIFSCLGFSLLLTTSKDKLSIAKLIIGIGLISIALNARAGAFFVLPALILWATTISKLNGKNVLHWIGGALLGVSIGFILQSILVLTIDGDPANSHGNFSYTLYGLSQGGKSWKQVQEDHPEVLAQTSGDAAKSKKVYSLAFKSLADNPTLLLVGFAKNFKLFLKDHTYGSRRLGNLGKNIFLLAWWVAWIPIWIHRKKLAYSLTGFCSLGIVASSLFLMTDGGPRVFASSIPIDVFQAALGLTWVAKSILSKLNSNFTTLDTHKRTHNNNPTLEYCLTSALILLISIPHLPIQTSRSIQSKSVAHCKNDQIAVRSKIGSGTMLIDINTVQTGNSILLGQMNINKFRGATKNAWWINPNSDYSNYSFLQTYQQDITMKDAGAMYYIYANQPLSKFYGKHVEMCIDATSQTIFGQAHTHHKLHSIRLLN